MPPNELDRKLGFATRAIRVEMREPEIPSRAIAPAIHQTASFAFESSDDVSRALHDPTLGHAYSRVSNPTVEVVERAVAEMEGAETGVAFASGMAAIHATVMTLCRAGDHIVAPASLYGGTFSLLREVVARAGVETTFVKNGDHEALRAALRPTTRVIYAETISNPALTVADLPRLAELARSQGARLVVDSTFTSPYLCRPLEHGADVVVHSASKFLGGHGDLLAGVVATNAELGLAIRRTSQDVGGTLAPMIAWLLLRGLKTLALRMERHSSSALELARALARHPRVVRAVYPGLAEHPDHALASRLFSRGFGGMLGLELAGDRADAARVMDRLRLFHRAGSLGDVHSLALQPAVTSHRQLDPQQLREAGISESYVRLSIGLEDPEDLVADLTSALDG